MSASSYVTSIVRAGSAAVALLLDAVGNPVGQAVVADPGLHRQRRVDRARDGRSRSTRRARVDREAEVIVAELAHVLGELEQLDEGLRLVRIAADQPAVLAGVIRVPAAGPRRRSPLRSATGPSAA